MKPLIFHLLEQLDKNPPKNRSNEDIDKMKTWYSNQSISNSEEAANSEEEYYSRQPENI